MGRNQMFEGEGGGGDLQVYIFPETALLLNHKRCWSHNKSPFAIPGVIIHRILMATEDLCVTFCSLKQLHDLHSRLKNKERRRFK
jgi:hypothetical protein